MPQQSSDEAQVLFYDASSYFSEEEWTLLQEWQKELYRNVMKEIHQALISLGPLIATTVCSLRAKEKEDVYTMDSPCPERRHRMNPSPRDTSASKDVWFRVNKEEHLRTNNLQHLEGRQRNDCHSAEFPFLNSDIHLRKEEEAASIFIDHLGETIGESSPESNLRSVVPTKVVTLRIKEEEESCSMEQQDSESLQTDSSPLDEATMHRQVQGVDPVKCTEIKTSCKVFPKKDHAKKRLHAEKEAHYDSQLWSEMNPELERVEPTPCKTGFSVPPAFSSHNETSNVPTSTNYDVYESAPTLANNFTCPPTTEPRLNLFSSTECENTFNKEYYIEHKATHKQVRPYQCIECAKSFSKKANLFVHMRTHTGERPYHCSICDKSFNQRGILTRHQRTHLRERPY